MEAQPLLSIENLKTYFYVRDRVAKAVNDVSLAIQPGETLGLVGESGCGKSVTAHSIIQLIPDPPGKIVDGRILFDGRDLLALSETDMRKIRGNRISMIFQEPMTSWGVLIAEGANALQSAPWSLVFPALFMAVTLFCFNFIGDGLRDALDPKDR